MNKEEEGKGGESSPAPMNIKETGEGGKKEESSEKQMMMMNEGGGCTSSPSSSATAASSSDSSVDLATPLSTLKTLSLVSTALEKIAEDEESEEAEAAKENELKKATLWITGNNDELMMRLNHQSYNLPLLSPNFPTLSSSSSS